MRVGVHESVYIRRFSEVKARMESRVCWSMWYEMSDLFCYFTAICQWCIHTELGFLNDEHDADYVNWRSSCWLIGWWFNEWIDGVISFNLMNVELKCVEWVQSENMMKSGLQDVLYESCWIQYENWWNVVYRGAEGRSLQWGGCSSLPVVASKRVQGVVAPFQERLVNESGGL